MTESDQYKPHNLATTEQMRATLRACGMHESVISQMLDENRRIQDIEFNEEATKFFVDTLQEQNTAIDENFLELRSLVIRGNNNEHTRTRLENTLMKGWRPFAVVDISRWWRPNTREIWFIRSI